MGLAATLFHRHRADVTLVCRWVERLEAARNTHGGDERVAVLPIDMTNTDQVGERCHSCQRGEINYLVVPCRQRHPEEIARHAGRPVAGDASGEGQNNFCSFE